MSTTEADRIYRFILKMRMHEEGPKQLVEGWTKNLATASQSTHLFVMLCIQLWIMGSFMALAALIGSFIVQQPIVIVSSVILYVVYGLRVLYDIATVQGSSGSPVLNENGELVAVNFAKYVGSIEEIF